MASPLIVAQSEATTGTIASKSEIQAVLFHIHFCLWEEISLLIMTTAVQILFLLQKRRKRAAPATALDRVRLTDGQPQMSSSQALD